MPTSPVSTPSLADDATVNTPAPLGRADAVFAEWRRFGTWLKRPSPERRSDQTSPLAVLARIFALDVAAMAVLIAASSIAVLAGGYLPETSLGGV